MSDPKKCGCKLGITIAALVGLGVGYGVSLLCADGGQQEAILCAAERDDAAKGAAAVRSLPDVQKAALIASRYGLLFIPGGDSGFQNDERYSHDLRVQEFPVRRGACYVDFEGKVRNFYKTIEHRKEKKQIESWMEAMRAIGAVSEDAVFAEMEDEVKRQALLTLKYHLDNMPADLRSAWLAEKAHLLFSEKGGTFYTGRVVRKRVPGTHVETISREVTGEAKYVDAAGRKCTFQHMLNKLSKQPRAHSSWQYASYCAAVMGTEAVLEAFAAEVEQMKKAAGK